MTGLRLYARKSLLALGRGLGLYLGRKGNMWGYIEQSVTTVKEMGLGLIVELTLCLDAAPPALGCCSG